MSLDGGPLWTGEQHAWLRALGHTMWVPGSIAAPRDEKARQAAAPAKRSGVPAAAQRDVAPPVRRQVPAAPAGVEVAPAAPPVRRAPAARNPRMPDPLHFALIRASGLNPSAEGAAELIAAWPAAAELRGNPAAKRALWVQLRALRRKASA